MEMNLYKVENGTTVFVVALTMTDVASMYEDATSISKVKTINGTDFTKLVVVDSVITEGAASLKINALPVS
jgi:hypothetical protein